MSKALPPKALYGWDSSSETWIKIQVDSNGKLQITSTSLATILSEIQDATYGLAALKDAIDAIPSGGATAQQVWEYATRRLTNLDDARAALLDLIDDIKAKTDLIPADISTQLDSNIPAIKAKTDNLPSDPADESELEARLGRKISHMDFWSNADDSVSITNSSSNIILPPVVVAGIPSGATVIRVVVMLKIALIRDTSGSDNAINTVSMTLQVDGDSGYGNPLTGINITNNSWAVDVSTSQDRGGDVLIGDDDVKDEVTGNGTWRTRFYAALADGNYLNLLDVAVGLRVYFY